VGPVFTVTAPDFTDVPAGPIAELFTWSGDLSAGKHTITLKATQRDGSCRASEARASGTCTAYRIHRSSNTNHTHFAVGTDTSEDWESFPASGNHWGAWAAWNTVYPKAIKRAFLLHNLEHGGAVLSYKCESVNGEGCKDKQDALAKLAQDENL